MEMSLEELKRQNAEEEPQTTDEPQAEVAEEAEAVEEQEVEPVEPEGSEEAGEAEAESIEAWMQSDDQASQDDEAVPLKAHLKLKRKLKERVSERDDEIAELKKENESLKSSMSAPAQTGKPKREDFLDAEDPEESYIDALSDWKINQQKKERELSSQRESQQRAQAEIAQRVEAHYQRAAKLLEDHKLDAAVYQSADSGFRQAVDAAFPDQGDAIADLMLSQIGEGSEKLVMYIGNNASRRERLKSALSEDPNGLAAMRLIGKWESEMVAPSKRSSQAPKPAKRVEGDEAGTSSIDSLRRRYKDAHKNKDAQKAFNIKREARAKNIDVSNW